MNARGMGFCAGAATLAMLFAGCGGDDGGDETSATEATAEETASCVESFTSGDTAELAGLASFSHAQGGTVTVGHYTGDEFTAEIYDVTTDGTGEDGTVAPGACVVTEADKSFGPLYLFAETDDGEWHRFLESDPKVPLVPDPEPQLEDVEQVEIEQIGS